MELVALLWDMDGTFAESEEVHRIAFNTAFKEFGVPWHWDRAIYSEMLTIDGGKERLRHYISRTHPEMMSRPDLYSFIEALHATKNHVYADMIAKHSIEVRPGVIRLIREAREKGLRLAIAAAAALENLHALFDEILGKDALSWFEAIGDGSKVPAKKPAPDIYHWVLQEMGLPPMACISIEDTPKGSRASLAAGVTSIVAVSTFTANEEFAGATAVLSDLGEPDKPFKVIAGNAYGHTCVTVDLLRKWHEESLKRALAS